MPKFFVCSDIHSFFTPFKKALDNAGFDLENENHWLIVCGDAFDRGDESNQILNYLLKLKRKILIRGNHEDLLEKCCKRGFPYSHDHHNGTVITIRDLGFYDEHKKFPLACAKTLVRTKPYREQLLDYFETKNYVFVHGWVPNYFNNYFDKWRNGNWNAARWDCGIEQNKKGINVPNKTIVCGHWHCSLGHCLDNPELTEFGDNAIWDPYYSEGIIAIDSCVAYTGKINVIVLEDEFI